MPAWNASRWVAAPRARHVAGAERVDSGTGRRSACHTNAVERVALRRTANRVSTRYCSQLRSAGQHRRGDEADDDRHRPLRGAGDEVLVEERADEQRDGEPRDERHHPGDADEHERRPSRRARVRA